jgi:hypothetical protein
MPCECSVAGLFEIGYNGIISATLTGSSEFIDIISACNEAPNVFSDVRKHLKGPSLGNLSLTAYAFLQGDPDHFLGTTCPSSAGISFPSQLRFDCENKVTHIIRTKTGEVFREGDPINGITLLGEFCSFHTINASAQGGPFNRVTDTQRFIGTDLVWTGPPFSFDSRNPDSLDFNILGLDVKLTNFSVSVTVPQVATNSYTFQYSIPSCEGALF